MKTRRIFAQPDEIIEIMAPDGQSVLKTRVLPGRTGHLQVFVHTQPSAIAHIDQPQTEIRRILDADPSLEALHLAMGTFQ